LVRGAAENGAKAPEDSLPEAHRSTRDKSGVNCGMMRASQPGRDAEATRQRLLRAALELYTTQGFRASTTPLIAARAGVAEGSIYRHFSGKEALFNATRRHALDWALGVIEEISASRLPAREALVRIGRRLAEAASRDAPAVRMTLAPPSDAPIPDEAVSSRDQALRAALQHLMASGKSDGEVRSGPAELWSDVWLAVLRYAVLRVAAGDWTPDHPQMGLVLEAAWDAVAARTTTASQEST
jgi:AcrR family transcriptional regulator